MAVAPLTGWETSELVLESGDFESRQRVLVAEPAVEASEAGARTLGGLLALRAGGSVTLAQRSTKASASNRVQAE